MPESHDLVVYRDSLFVARVYAGDAAGALAVLDDEARAAARRDYGGAWITASGYALLGRADEAIDWLEIAAERGFIHHRFVAELDPFLAGLRRHPRFVELLATMRRRAADLTAAATPRAPPDGG